LARPVSPIENIVLIDASSELALTTFKIRFIHFNSFLNNKTILIDNMEPFQDVLKFMNYVGAVGSDYYGLSGEGDIFRSLILRQCTTSQHWCISNRVVVNKLY
jgi:hypothetical protein